MKRSQANQIHRSALKALTLLCAISALGCGSGGGGGGGSDFVGAATISIALRPSKIDTGDQTEVRAIIADVNDNGIALKFRFPSGLRYVPNSAFLDVNDDELDISPTVNAAQSRSDEQFLVFYLTQAQFKRSGSEYNGESGVFSFQLEGTETVKDGDVEVDPDVDDPDIDNASEFNIETPEFSAEDKASIEVRD